MRLRRPIFRTSPSFARAALRHFFGESPSSPRAWRTWYSCSTAFEHGCHRRRVDLPAAAHLAAHRDAERPRGDGARRLRVQLAQERHDLDAGHRRAPRRAGPERLEPRVRGDALLRRRRVLGRRCARGAPARRVRRARPPRVEHARALVAHAQGRALRLRRPRPARRPRQLLAPPPQPARRRGHVRGRVARVRRFGRADARARSLSWSSPRQPPREAVPRWFRGGCSLQRERRRIARDFFARPPRGAPPPRAEAFPRAASLRSTAPAPPAPRRARRDGIPGRAARNDETRRPPRRVRRRLRREHGALRLLGGARAAPASWPPLQAPNARVARSRTGPTPSATRRCSWFATKT